MTLEEFKKLTNLPEAQYAIANANYEASRMEKEEWAKYYIQVVNNPLYQMAETLRLENEELGAMMTDQVKQEDLIIEKLQNEIKELTEFIAEQAEAKQSRTLAIKAGELMGDREYLMWKLQRGYYLGYMDKKKIAALLAYNEASEEEQTNEEEA